jgi:hypothetical protein
MKQRLAFCSHGMPKPYMRGIRQVYLYLLYALEYLSKRNFHAINDDNIYSCLVHLRLHVEVDSDE